MLRLYSKHPREQNEPARFGMTVQLGDSVRSAALPDPRCRVKRIHRISIGNRFAGHALAAREYFTTS